MILKLLMVVGAFQAEDSLAAIQTYVGAPYPAKPTTEEAKRLQQMLLSARSDLYKQERRHSDGHLYDWGGTEDALNFVQFLYTECKVRIYVVHYKHDDSEAEIVCWTVLVPRLGHTENARRRILTICSK